MALACHFLVDVVALPFHSLQLVPVLLLVLEVDLNSLLSFYSFVEFLLLLAESVDQDTMTMRNTSVEVTRLVLNPMKLCIIL